MDFESAVIVELRELKDRALKASAQNDSEFYDSYLSDDAVAVLPEGRLDKAQLLASMIGERAPFAPKRIEDTRIRALGSDAGVVTFRAIHQRGAEEVAVLVTTVYERRADGWKSVHYQQTPLPI
jgi:hypothetical protein